MVFLNQLLSIAPSVLIFISVPRALSQAWFSNHWAVFTPFWFPSSSELSLGTAGLAGHPLWEILTPVSVCGRGERERFGAPVGLDYMETTLVGLGDVYI